MAGTAWQGMACWLLDGYCATVVLLQDSPTHGSQSATSSSKPTAYAVLYEVLPIVILSFQSLRHIMHTVLMKLVAAIGFPGSLGLIGDPSPSSGHLIVG
jgi:hypothetical protein